MEVKVLYFGMIAEVTNSKEEVISINEGSNVVELEDLLKEKYQKLKQLSFKIAIDQEISSGTALLSSNNQIALLPPFSGG